jgi:hypothetical protein
MNEVSLKKVENMTSDEELQITNSDDNDNMERMNILIPIGGIGSRFRTEGYRFPKPLINIEGRPMLFWLIDHLKV